MAEDKEAKEILGTLDEPVETEGDVIDPQGLELREEVIHLNRVAKVVKGGRRFSFSALVVVGNEEGIVGVGYGKAREVPLSISKAVENAKHNLFRVWRRGTTLPYQVHGEYGGARVLLKPASTGTGIIAGTAVRTVCELAGVQNVLTKSLGSNNIINVVKATAEGLARLQNPRRVAELRGKTLEELMGKKVAAELMRREMPPSQAEAGEERQDTKDAAEQAKDQQEAEAIPDATPVSQVPAVENAPQVPVEIGTTDAAASEPVSQGPAAEPVENGPGDATVEENATGEAEKQE